MTHTHTHTYKKYLSEGIIYMTYTHTRSIYLKKSFTWKCFCPVLSCGVGTLQIFIIIIIIHYNENKKVSILSCD